MSKWIKLGYNRVNVIIHCNIQHRCMSNSFVVTGNGLVFECRGWKKKPLLPEKYQGFQSKAFYIGLLGMYGGKYLVTFSKYSD